jgi:hypothetical protein
MGLQYAALQGWSDDGRPFAAPGAPMVPPNQDVAITSEGVEITYHATTRGRVAPGEWQIALHHGCGYVVGLNEYNPLAAPLQLLPAEAPPNLGFVPLPLSWGEFYEWLRFIRIMNEVVERIDADVEAARERDLFPDMRL